MKFRLNGNQSTDKHHDVKPADNLRLKNLCIRIVSIQIMALWRLFNKQQFPHCPFQKAAIFKSSFVHLFLF